MKKEINLDKAWVKSLIQGYLPVNQIESFKNEFGIKLEMVFDGMWMDVARWCQEKKLTSPCYADGNDSWYIGCPLSYGSMCGWDVTADGKFALCRIQYDHYRLFQVSEVKSDSPESKKKIIFIDMDGVIVDFVKGMRKHPGYIEGMEDPDELPGVFDNLEPIENAIESVNLLLENSRFDVYIASAAPWNNVGALPAKRLWIEKYFGEKFKKRLILTHQKQLLIGDYLIDDRKKNGAGEFRGEHIHFGKNGFENWEKVTKYLTN